MIDLDVYTMDWNDALRPTAPKVGTEVIMANGEYPTYGDMYNDFTRVLSKAGLKLEYDRQSEDDREIWIVTKPLWDDGYDYDDLDLCDDPYWK